MKQATIDMKMKHIRFNINAEVNYLIKDVGNVLGLNSAPLRSEEDEDVSPGFNLPGDDIDIKHHLVNLSRRHR